MKLYQFKTRTTSYFFPKLTERSRFIYSLYGNYGNLLGRVAWWLFLHCGYYRKLHSIESSSIPALHQIEDMLGSSSIFGINLGTPGSVQKMSVLGYNISSGEKFFAKFSKKNRAKILSKNEIYVYQTLAGTGLVPKLFDFKITDEFVFLKTECIDGNHVSLKSIDEKILGVLQQLQMYHYARKTDSLQLKSCFSHGDFCPWNMLECNGNIRLIDWEMADERPLGHDLFTFIFQTAFLMQRDISCCNLLEKNKSVIDEFFWLSQIEDWTPYLKNFAQLKIAEFSQKRNAYMLSRYKELLDAK